MAQPLLYRTSSGLQFLSLLLILLLSLLFTLVFGMALGVAFFGTDVISQMMDGVSFTDPSSMPLLKYLQVINTLGLFLFPPLIFAFLVSKRPISYLGMNISPSLRSSFLGVMVILVILPFLHWTAGLNEMMKLPEFMSGIENWMMQSEEQAAELTELFLSTTTVSGLLVNLFMIAVLPALGEEFLFRGVLLKIFRRWTGSIHLAVIISAILFSALHLQFYGFLPRFLLGLVLGYLFVWTRSIWVPVIVHFFNNGIAVYAGWLFARGEIASSADSFGDTVNPYFIAGSFMLTLLFLLGIRYLETQKKGSTNE